MHKAKNRRNYTNIKENRSKILDRIVKDWSIMMINFMHQFFLSFFLFLLWDEIYLGLICWCQVTLQAAVGRGRSWSLQPQAFQTASATTRYTCWLSQLTFWWAVSSSEKQGNISTYLSHIIYVSVQHILGNRNFKIST